MQVATGATDFHTAMRDSIIELGGSGVRVDYGGGVTRRLDTVVRQNLLWGAKQASTEYNTMIGEELGCDGIEVDFHSNPRQSHEFMQGKQYVLGKSRTINGTHFESADEALERLQDYGCLHYKTPIICGISEPRYSTEELKRLNEQNARRYTIDGKEYSGYGITQMQRRLETAVRNEKTTRDLAKASGDNALVKRCNERIKAYQGKYDDISTITGIQGDKKRMSVPKSKNVLTNNTNSSIIKTSNKKPKDDSYRLPNSISASTIQEKVQGYFLNSNHPVGKHKARVLNSVLGYHYENWQELSDKMFDAVQTASVTKEVVTEHGTKYKVPITIMGRKNKSMVLNTVWQIDKGSNIPRFITTTFDKRTIKEVK